MLNIFEEAPDFSVQAGDGLFGFRVWKGRRWAVVVLVSGRIDPDELGALIALGPRLARRDVKVAVVETGASSSLAFPAPFLAVAGDPDGTIRQAYGLKETMPPGSRSVFLISPTNGIGIAHASPACVPLDFDETLRTLDALQMTKYKIATPADWKQGDDMVAGRVLPDPVVVAHFGPLREVFHYLRFVAQPAWELWRADKA